MVTADCRPHYDILILDVVASHIPFHALSASLPHFSGDYFMLCLHNSIVEQSGARACVWAPAYCQHLNRHVSSFLRFVRVSLLRVMNTSVRDG